MMILRLLLTISIFTQFLFAQNYGSLHFARYADNKTSAFSFTFDDGLKTHYDNAKGILDEYGFKGTFNVLPAFLSNNNQTIWRYGRWDQFIALANEDHEIASHSIKHYDLTTLEWGSITTENTLLYELYQSKKMIEDKIPDKKCISFAYPYTYHNAQVDSATSLFYENGRTFGEAPNNFSLSGNQWYGLKCNVVEFNNPRNSVEDDLDEFYAFTDWFDNYINSGKWGMIMIHDIVPFSQLQELLNQGLYYPTTNEWFEWLCVWMKEKSDIGKVWVQTVGNITRYIKERDRAVYQVVSSTNQKIEINVTDDLDNSIYNYPLSAFVKVPNDWNFVRTEQNGKVDTLSSITTDTGKVVLAKVIPDNGLLKLTPVSPTDVNDNQFVINDYKLEQNFPNPFSSKGGSTSGGNPTTKIRYSIPNAGIGLALSVLKVYDILGNEVATLVNEQKEPGYYEVEFNASQLASGVYIYRLQAGSFTSTKKMLLLR